MDISNKHITFVWQLNCEYGGGIIPLFSELASELRTKFGCKISWVFPQQSQRRDWIDEIKKNDKVYFVSSVDAYEQDFENILAIIKPDIVHTNFEMMDIAVSKAIHKLGLATKLVFHIHDALRFNKNVELYFIRKHMWNYRMAKRYHKWGKDAYFVPVSEDMAQFVHHYRKHRFLLPPDYQAGKNIEYDRCTIVPNGISTERIDRIPYIKVSEKPTNPFSFLSFGGRIHVKGIDVLISAGDILIHKGYNFQIMLTSTPESRKQVLEYCKEKLGYHSLPDWLKLIDQTQDIASIMNLCNCYVSAARAETFSLAICEATFMRLPIIQSEIAGTQWNESNPSVLTFPNEDSDKLASCMESMINWDKNDLSDKCEITNTNNRNSYSSKKWINTIVDIYKGL